MKLQKKIIKKRLDLLGIDEYNLRLDSSTGNVDIET